MYLVWEQFVNQVSYNIFLFQIVIIDFGLAKKMTCHELLRGLPPCRTPVGTDGYKVCVLDGTQQNLVYMEYVHPVEL